MRTGYLSLRSVQQARASVIFTLGRIVAVVVLAAVLAAIGSTELRAKEPKENPNDDFENAQRLNIRFSQIPLVYCKTPAAVEALATLTNEVALLDSEIDQNMYDVEKVSSLGLVSHGREAVAGKEGLVGSLKRIRHRLNSERYQLLALPPCATDYRTVFSNGILLGIYIIKSTGNTVITERFITTDRITNEFSNSHDPVGVGVNIAYAFTPWNNGFVVAPFAALDYLNNSVNHNFAGGSYLGSTANVSGTAGVKIGPSVTPNFWLYGIAGVSVLNETLNVNFLPVMSSTSKTVAGGTVGGGFAFKPSFLQNWGRPVSLFAEYQHTWWQDAQFNSPLASPLFNYNFRRQDDVIKLGFNVHFDEPPPAAPPAFPVKALPAK